MRGCRNALEAALGEQGNAHDLVDAYEYAEKVIEDLTDGIGYFQELVRHLMQNASVHTQWSEFVEFLGRFERDYSKQLTADNATLNRQSIRHKLEKLRVVPDNKFKRVDAQLHDIANGPSRSTTAPQCMTGCSSALRTSSMMLRAGQTRHSYMPVRFVRCHYYTCIVSVPRHIFPLNVV